MGTEKLNIVNSQMCPPGGLARGRLNASYVCGNCRMRIQKTGGRRLINGKWICPPCQPHVSDDRSCCKSKNGKPHQKACPMTRPRNTSK